MTLLFLTMNRFGDGTEHGIYTDLMRKFRDEGHNVYVVFPLERSFRKATTLLVTNGMHILGVRTLNLQKTNVIEKGLGQVSLEYLYIRALKKYFGHVKFDLITYSTPPITFTKVIEWAKKHNPEAKTYLMLKDIFPQNAVDLGMLTKSGLKGILYRQFRKKEEKLYAISDYIGCMSPANVKYVIEHNPDVSADKVELCPNSYDVQEASPQPSPEINKLSSLQGGDGGRLQSLPSGGDLEEATVIRAKYGLPIDKPIFIYGGNLGKPQGIPFFLECLKANKNRTDCHFVVVGNGTEYPKIESWVKSENPTNISLYQRLPKEDYDKLANACDVGLIFLDYRFTIPNYPSRLLPYLMGKKPIIACTDPNCDTGIIANENGYGMWCPSNNVEAFTESVNQMLKEDIKAMGEKGYQFFLQNYTVDNTYNSIIKHFEK